MPQPNFVPSSRGDRASAHRNAYRVRVDGDRVRPFTFNSSCGGSGRSLEQRCRALSFVGGPVDDGPMEDEEGGRATSLSNAQRRRQQRNRGLARRFRLSTKALGRRWCVKASGFDTRVSSLAINVDHDPAGFSPARSRGDGKRFG